MVQKRLKIRPPGRTNLKLARCDNNLNQLNRCIFERCSRRIQIGQLYSEKWTNPCCMVWKQGMINSGRQPAGILLARVVTANYQNDRNWISFSLDNPAGNVIHTKRRLSRRYPEWSTDKAKIWNLTCAMSLLLRLLIVVIITSMNSQVVSVSQI